MHLTKTFLMVIVLSAQIACAMDIDSLAVSSSESATMSLTRDASLKAAREGDLAGLKLLAEQGANLLLAEDETGLTAAHLAASNNRTTCLGYLLEKYPSCVNVLDSKHNTPLHLAASNNHKAAAILLLASEAHIQAKNIDGNSPLHLAALSNSIECVKILLHVGADRKAQNREGRTPDGIVFSMALKRMNDQAEAYKSECEIGSESLARLSQLAKIAVPAVDNYFRDKFYYYRP